MVKVENIKPLNDRILVKPVSTEETTESGIVIPDTAKKEKPEQGEVLAVGPGGFDEDGERLPMSVEVGQTVMFTKYAPNEIEIEGEEYFFVREKDVLAILDQ